MTETISFPGLGWEFNVNPVAFYLPEFLGGWAIFWYGIIIALALLAGILFFFARTKEFAVDNDRATDVLMVSIICAVIGARLYYVAFSWDTYRDDPMRIFNIREGGLAIYGCIIGAIISAALMCKIRRVRFLPLMDLVSGGLLLGQGIGRWANFINVEAFGSNTTAPWGMKSASISRYLMGSKAELERIGVAINPDIPVHPTFFYESMWCLAGFLLLLWFTKRRRFDGQLTLLYLGWYGLGRFLIEGLRTDSLMIGTIRVSQILAMLCFLASAAVLVFILSGIRREGDPSYLMLYRDTEEGKLVLAGEFYKKSSKEDVKASAESEGDIAGSEEEDTPKTAAAETEEETESEADDEEGAADDGTAD